jgi:ribonucleoside-diphosphate reductase beta chain
MEEKLVSKKELYNPDSKETPSTQKVFGGDPSGIINMNRIKYQWAYDLWERMLANTWFTKEVNMTADTKDYKALTTQEKNAYDKALSQLIFMDSLQTANIGSNIEPYITSAELTVCFARQAFEEALHSVSYAVMVDSISANTDEIYDMFKVDAQLRSKNSFVAKTYRDLAENPTETNILKSFFANQILEGIYFYSGFAYIYTLAKSGKMLASAEMIRFIQRDEVTHLELFSNTILEVYKEKPYLFTPQLYEDVYQMYREAVEHEIAWGKYITEGQILGLTDNIIENYIKHLADQRMYVIRNAGFKKIYGVDHSLKWIDSFSSINSQKANFFESTPLAYSKGTLEIDDF